MRCIAQRSIARTSKDRISAELESTNCRIRVRANAEEFAYGIAAADFKLYRSEGIRHAGQRRGLARAEGMKHSVDNEPTNFLMRKQTDTAFESTCMAGCLFSALSGSAVTRDQRELKKGVQRCVFNVLMNNRDDHAKNLSFAMGADGTWQLAPPYDLTFCPGYRGEHFMDVAGERRAPTRQHVLKAAHAAGLPRNVAQDAIDEVLARGTPQILLEFAALVPVRAATLERVRQAMQANFNRLS